VGYLSPVVGAAASFATPEAAALHLRHASVTETDPADTADGDWSAEADFRPARGESGFPAPTSFGHAVLGGTRLAYPEALYEGLNPSAPGVPDADRFGLQLLDSRPVDCQELREFPYTQLLGQSLEGLPEGVSGLPLLPTTLCGRQSGDATLALKDLRGSGGVASAAPGGTATVPFTLRYAGEAGPTFALSATSAVGGETATPSAPALTPAAAGFQDLAVTVAVPAGATPGDYAVTLTASVGGQVRKAVGTLIVTGPAAGTAGAGAGTQDQEEDPGTVGGVGTPSTVFRALEFRGFDRSGLGPDGKSINLGDVLCHKPRGACGSVRIQLSVGWEQLHLGAQMAANRVRMIVIGSGRLSVPAQGRRRVRITVSKRVRRMLGDDQVIHAIVSVRAAHNAPPIVHRVELRRS
jgi:hypothetical protein